MKMMDDPTTKLYEDLKKAEESGKVKKIDIVKEELKDLSQTKSKKDSLRFKKN